MTEHNGGNIIVGHPWQAPRSELARAMSLSAFLEYGRKSGVEMFVDLKPRDVQPYRLVRDVLDQIETQSTRRVSVVVSRDESLLRAAREDGVRTGHIIDIGTSTCAECTYNLVSIREKRKLMPDEVKHTILTEVRMPDEVVQCKKIGVPYAMSDKAKELLATAS